MSFKKILANFIFIALVANFSNAFAFCKINNSSNEHDPLQAILSRVETCPVEVYEFRQLLENHQLTLISTLVANRGIHNSALGSYSVFSMAQGHIAGYDKFVNPEDLFFGHFIGPDDNNILVTEQSYEAGSLIIEALAWDKFKNVYNFYELRGTGQSAEWFYRGDSLDIFADNEKLHRQDNSAKPVFGRHLRCSACHANGGPIMKELIAPHNDWLTWNHELDFAGRKIEQPLQTIIAQASSANVLAASVQFGLTKLQNSSAFQHHMNARNFQEQLRPLFCPVEVNFASDIASLASGRELIEIPADFFLDPRLLNKKIHFKINQHAYQTELEAAQSRFPETDLHDADHAWLTPVKAYSDILAVDKLVKRGLVDAKFVRAVLAVDMTNPVFSQRRCELLRLMPNDYRTNWQEEVKTQLQQSTLPGAPELLKNLQDPRQVQIRVKRYVRNCENKLNDGDAIHGWFKLLTQRRTEIALSEISKNPLGKILEPGFRVIFPTTNYHFGFNQLNLNEACLVT